MMIKNTNGFDQVTKSMYTFKSLIGRLKILSTKENAARIKIEEVLFNLEVYSTFVLCLYRICDEKLLKILSKMFNISKACNFTKTWESSQKFFYHKCRAYSFYNIVLQNTNCCKTRTQRHMSMVVLFQLWIHYCNRTWINFIIFIGRFRTAATSKMKHFVTKVNNFQP